ncbi:hypothetical protein ACFFGT_15595 [Mucilaginibacter angelicae]|uniref:Copper chaperone NosL n=1 Tax=Mucilaginibacter angelicae TaxID=869718 RepID=A0ABV6L870_9SPHI
MKAAFIAISLAITISSCQLKQAKMPVTKPAVTRPYFFENQECKVCDTCTTKILALHEEATDSGDVLVDSGIVYIPTFVANKIIHQLDSLKKAYKPNSIFRKEMYDQFDYGDINFVNGKAGFIKLWKDTINFSDLDQPYRLQCKIVDSFVTQEGFPRLLFRMEKATAVDKSYIKKMEKERAAKFR